jgi:hypothetical protein
LAGITDNSPRENNRGKARRETRTLSVFRFAQNGKETLDFEKQQEGLAGGSAGVDR